jgi:hypothetical protein
MGTPLDLLAKLGLRFYLEDLVFWDKVGAKYCAQSHTTAGLCYLQPLLRQVHLEFLIFALRPFPRANKGFDEHSVSTPVGPITVEKSFFEYLHRSQFVIINNFGHHFSALRQNSCHFTAVFRIPHSPLSR